MLNTPPEVNALLSTLAIPTWTLAAMGALFESGLAAELREPHTLEELCTRCTTMSKGRIRRCLDLAAIVGLVGVDGDHYRLAPGATCFAGPPLGQNLKGDIRSHLMQALAFLDAAGGEGPSTGWRHTDPALLQAQGDGSATFAPALKAKIAPLLGDLSARLEKPGARFLDVGTGVGSLAIALCRVFPALSIVALDTYDVALDLARRNVAQADLSERIEIRKLGVEALRDEAGFDLAWIPSMFIAEATLPAALARVRAALRPGGWLLLPIGGFVGAEHLRAVFSLITETWGGPVLDIADAEGLLQHAGFTTVKVLPTPPTIPPVLAASC